MQDVQTISLHGKVNWPGLGGTQSELYHYNPTCGAMETHVTPTLRKV